MERERSPHKDVRGVGILEGDQVCFGFRSGNTGGLRAGHVLGVTEKGVHCEWYSEKTKYGTETKKPSTVKIGKRLCVVQLPKAGDEVGDEEA